jgi:hypothetical protein
MPIELFPMPREPHVRRHGPNYSDYTRCKPWLRDEFQFRCVYCMFRERWERGGWRRYHVDHLVPQSVHPSRITDYENLVYSCDICNQFKSDGTMPSPCEVAYGLHYKINDEGEPVSLSGGEGQALIEIIGLNDPDAIAYRRRWIKTMREFLALKEEIGEPIRTEELMRWFGYPDDMPDLRRHMPISNCRVEGKHQTYLLRLRRGEIDPLY